MNKRRRIVIISNSQGTTAGVSRGESYPQLVQRGLGDGFEVHFLVFNGWSIDDMIAALPDNVLAVEPDLVIVNAGIIEAAQRILSVREKLWLSCLPLGQHIGGLLHRRRWTVLRLRRKLGLATRVMTADQFTHRTRRFADTVRRAGSEVLFLEMPVLPDAGAALRHPFINQDLDLYNRAFAGNPVAQVDCTTWDESCFQFGTVHFSPLGHERIAQVLISTVKSLLGDDADREVQPHEFSGTDPGIEVTDGRGSTSDQDETQAT